MVIGITLFLLANGAYHSPAFPRGGPGAVFSAEVYQMTAVGLTIVVEHKNVEDTSWANAGSFAVWSAAGVKTLDVSGLKELVRFAYAVSGNNGYEGVHFGVFAPAWKP